MYFWPNIALSKLQKTASTVHEIDLQLLDGNEISHCFGPSFNDLRSKMIMLKSINGMEQWANHNDFVQLTANNWDLDEARIPTNGFYDSIDQIIAKEIYKDNSAVTTRILNSNIHWADRSSQSFIVKDGKPVAQPGYNNPASLFDDFFKSQSAPSTNPSDVDSNKQEELAIDKVLEHYNSVRKNRRLSAQDKMNLDIYANELFETQQKIKSISTPQVSCEQFSIPSSLSKKDDLKTYIEVSFKLLSMAIKCDHTRIINCYYDPNTMLKPFFNGKFKHGISHNEAEMKIYGDMYRWEHEYIAQFIKDLNVDDPLNEGQKILDNTLVFQTNEIGSLGKSTVDDTYDINADPKSLHDGNHIRVNVPCVFYGNVNNFFKTGRFIDYRNQITPANSKDYTTTRLNTRWYVPVGHPYNQVMTTIMSAFGVTHDKWEKPGIAGYGDYYGGMYRKGHPDFMSLGTKRDPLPKISG